MRLSTVFEGLRKGSGRLEDGDMGVEAAWVWVQRLCGRRLVLQVVVREIARRARERMDAWNMNGLAAFQFREIPAPA